MNSHCPTVVIRGNNLIFANFIYVFLFCLICILGRSLYDVEATVIVVIEKEIVIHCKNAVEGFLVLLLTYFVFGYCYPQEIEKTLEFLQR